ncbi:MAG: DedA family protein [Planctomycetes bacterium]|nr:DedA family protein [Planctomycetota bacterium]
MIAVETLIASGLLAFDLQGLFEEYTYLAVALALFLMGLGLPVPEELALVLAGYLAWADLAQLWLMMATCAAAITLGDLLPYLAGRLFGERFLRSRPARRWLNPRRMRRFNQLFLRYGAKVVFFARFFPGVRSVAYVVAGSLGMPLARFLFLDGLGILVTVPTFVGIGYAFGRNIDDALQQIRQVEHGLFWAIGCGLLVAALWIWWKRRGSRPRAEASSSEGQAGE